MNHCTAHICSDAAWYNNCKIKLNLMHQQLSNICSHFALWVFTIHFQNKKKLGNSVIRYFFNAVIYFSIFSQQFIVKKWMKIHVLWFHCILVWVFIFCPPLPLYNIPFFFLLSSYFIFNRFFVRIVTKKYYYLYPLSVTFLTIPYALVFSSIVQIPLRNYNKFSTIPAVHGSLKLPRVK